MKENNNNSKDSMALTRYAAVIWIEQTIRELNLWLAEAIIRATQRPWPDENGKYYKTRTLEEWWYNYQHKGFAGISGVERKDKGQSRSLTGDQKHWVIEQVTANAHKIQLKPLYDHWMTKDIKPPLPSLSTIYRFLRQEGLDALSLKRGRLETGPTKAFEAPYANDLWMVDFSPGPKIKSPQGLINSQLCVIIDDYSRLITYGAYYSQANTVAFHETLKQAVLRRGVPFKLYTDQGKPFVNHHSRLVCANLGIRLLHARPYHSWSKGKIERMLQSIQTGFEATLRLDGNSVASLDEINEKLSAWIQGTYHLRKHSSTKEAPQTRFLAQQQNIRELDSHLDIERLFYTSIERTVRKNGIVQIDSQLYEVDLALRTLKVQLRFDPVKMDPIEVWYKKRQYGYATPVDLNLNCNLRGRKS